MVGQIPKIETMYAYISHGDGPDDEGVTAYLRGTPLSSQWVPMVGADRERMDSLRAVAQKMADKARQKITLAKFTVRTDLETIEPAGVKVVIE